MYFYYDLTMLVNNIENINKEAAINLLRKQSNKDLSILMKDIMKSKIGNTKDMWEINKFFSELYDDLYYDIIFKKIKIDKRISRILESLAMPLDRKTDNEWKNIIDKILK